MTGFGDNLRREREARGVSLEDISSATKISVRLLQAIENEEFERLPGGVFNTNFVRQYARHLGLEEEKIVNEFCQLTTPPEESAPLQRPGVSAEWVTFGDYEWDRQRQSQIWKLALFGVLLVGLVGGLYFWWAKRRVAPVPAEPPPTAAQPTGSVAAPAPPAEVPGAEASPESSAAGSEPARQDATTAAGADQGPLRVEIRAMEPVWVAALADGQLRFQTTLQARQTRTVVGQAVIRLRLGNAGGVSLFLNGTAQPTPGPKGQIRTVIFTPQGMRVVAPPPEEEDEQPSQAVPTPAARNR